MQRNKTLLDQKADVFLKRLQAKSAKAAKARKEAQITEAALLAKVVSVTLTDEEKIHHQLINNAALDRQNLAQRNSINSLSSNTSAGSNSSSGSDNATPTPKPGKPFAY